jgi:hypothetical protein
MPAAAKEAREEVEGVMIVSAPALLPLLEAFVSVLVVDFTGFGLRECFVGFGNFNEFLFSSFVAPDF